MHEIFKPLKSYVVMSMSDLATLFAAEGIGTPPGTLYEHPSAS